MGLRPGEMVGRNALEIYADNAQIIDNLKLALAGEPSRFVAEWAERVYETIVRPLRSHSGEIVGVVGVAIDTTEQAMTAEALAESEDRFRASFHQAPLGAAHASLDGIVLRANEPLAELLGVLPQEVVGKRLRDWYASDADIQEDSATVQMLLSEPLPRVSSVRVMKSDAGDSIRVVVSLSIIRDRKGEQKHLVYTVTPLP
jgi:PAS domain S-box-containing protein